MKKRNIFFKKFFKNFSPGKSEIPIVLITVGLGVVLAGGLLSSYHPGFYSYQSIYGAALCCDSGDGPDCHVNRSQTFNFLDATGKSVPYGLLKSNITLKEGGNHLKDSAQRFNGNPIAINEIGRASCRERV